MKYYYDCPIEACYMIKNFDMGVILRHGDTPCGINTILKTDDYRNRKRFWVRPDSIALLEPKVGDLVYSRDFGCAEVSYRGYDNEPMCLDINEDEHDLTGSKIIQRDNKPFIIPKTEKL